MYFRGYDVIQAHARAPFPIDFDLWFSVKTFRISVVFSKALLFLVGNGWAVASLASSLARGLKITATARGTAFVDD